MRYRMRVAPYMFSNVAAGFQDFHLGVATCPYGAVPGSGFWSRLETVGMNTDFMAGVLVARMLEGMRFAVGPTTWHGGEPGRNGRVERLKDYLAEDFVMGKLAAEAGYGVALSLYVIEHHIGSSDLRHNIAHRLRWVRSTRRSRHWSSRAVVHHAAAVSSTGLRREASLVANANCGGDDEIDRRLCRLEAVLHAKIDWLLLPIEDFATFCVWIAGFFGNTIVWRGRRYRLHATDDLSYWLPGRPKPLQLIAGSTLRIFNKQRTS